MQYTSSVRHIMLTAGFTSRLPKCVVLEMSKEHPLISVIVVNWNGLGLLDQCFESLAKQTWRNKEFILVDNGSTDGSRELLSSWAERLPAAQSILLPTN